MQNTKILVLDDEPDLRALLQRYLTHLLQFVYE